MQARASVEKKASKPRPRSTKSKETETEKEKERPAAPRSKEKDMAKEKEKEKEKAAPPPHVATPARLLLRVHSAKKLHVGAFAQGVYCKMYVGETAMLHGSQKSLFSKMTGSGHAEDTTAEAALVTPHHREFRTRTVAPPADGAEGVALWDENFDVLLTDASRDILSIRVKCKHRLYPAVLGVCAISLKQLRIGHSVDTWVPLLKGTREVASLKLQIVLSPVTDPLKNAERLAKPDLQADIKTALAANQSADDAIERLLASATLKLSNRGGTAIPTDNNDKHDDHNKSPNESSSPRLSDGDKNHRHKNNENTSHPEMAVPKARAPVAATPTFSA